VHGCGCGNRVTAEAKLLLLRQNGYCLVHGYGGGNTANAEGARLTTEVTRLRSNQLGCY
jgi:hypothetical protein